MPNLSLDESNDLHAAWQNCNARDLLLPSPPLFP